MEPNHESLIPRPKPRPVGVARQHGDGYSDPARIKRIYPAAEQGVQILTGGHVEPTADIIEQKKAELEYQKRQRMASMDAHREKAAIAIAAGASNKLAAAFAGCSSRQVVKYLTYQSFRDRVLELRAKLMGRIEGRIMMEFLRRTEPDKITSMENGELMRLLDRAQGTARMKGGMAEVEQSQAEGQERYEIIIEQLTNIDARTQSVDFPKFEPAKLQLPGTSSPVEG